MLPAPPQVDHQPHAGQARDPLERLGTSRPARQKRRHAEVERPLRKPSPKGCLLPEMAEYRRARCSEQRRDKPLEIRIPTGFRSFHPTRLNHEYSSSVLDVSTTSWSRANELRGHGAVSVLRQERQTAPEPTFYHESSSPACSSIRCRWNFPRRKSSQRIVPYFRSGQICAPSRKARAALPGSGSSTSLFLHPTARR